MRKLVLLLLLFTSFTQISFAQQKMTDDQVMQYVIEAREKGGSQQKMAADLLQRGVTMDQINRIKEKYEKSQQTGVVGNTINTKDRSRNKQTENRDGAFRLKDDKQGNQKRKNKTDEYFPRTEEE